MNAEVQTETQPTTLAEAAEQSIDNTLPESNETNNEDSTNEEVSSNEIPAEDNDSDTDENKPSIKKLKEKMRRREQEARNEAEYWKREALARQTAPAPQAQAAPVVSDKPKIEQFTTMEDYTDALTDWKLNQRDLVNQQRQLQEKQNRVQQDYNQRAAAFAESTDDYDEVIADASRLQMDSEGLIIQTVLESDVGPQLAYYLAKNTDEINRLKNLSPQRRLIELGKLEDKVSSKSQVQQRETKKVPAPVTPVKGKAVLTTKSEHEMSPQELIASRNARDRARMGR